MHDCGLVRITSGNVSPEQRLDELYSVIDYDPKRAYDCSCLQSNLMDIRGIWIEHHHFAGSGKMPSITSPLKLCDAISRRELLRVGALSPIGLSLPMLLAPRAAGGEMAAPRVRAKSCLIIFMEGGASHIDLWDMKPNAPAQVRGEFKPIATQLPGVMLCEHLPMTAPHWHKLAQINSVTHSITDHNAGSYYALTGRSPVDQGKLIVSEAPGNFPPFGAVLSKLRPSSNELPNFVHIPEIMSNNNFDIPGELAGFLGGEHDPFITGDPSLRGYRTPGLSPQPAVSLDRLSQRDELLSQLDRSLGQRGDDAAIARMDQFQRKAVAMITSAKVREAFDLSREPQSVRERYGVDPGSNRAIEARKFGGLPHLGQSMLLARRLIEAGVPLITLVTGRRIDQAWDTHRDHFPLLKKSLLPPFDRAFSALLEEMTERGLLDDTLLVVMGEFGRTPKLGYVTSSAGAAANGRDHWPYCYSIQLAGAGIPAGLQYGMSDQHAAYPSRDAVTPEDIAATIYTLLGIPIDAEIRDPLGRPHRVIIGKPIEPFVS